MEIRTIAANTVLKYAALKIQPHSSSYRRSTRKRHKTIHFTLSHLLKIGDFLQQCQKSLVVKILVMEVKRSLFPEKARVCSALLIEA